MQVEGKYTPRATITTILGLTVASWAGVALLVEAVVSLTN